MNYIRVSLFTVFLAFTALCVGYAHSQARRPADGSLSYSSHNFFLSNCQLNVKHEGATTYYSVPGVSNTRFAGFWPDSAAEPLKIPAAYREVTVNGETGLAGETITVQFGMVRGEIHPVGYEYNNEIRTASRDVALPHSCRGVTQDL